MTPGTTFPITDFGAEPGADRPPQHAAIQRALDACRDAGGGTVVVPPGTWHTGSIRIHSFTRFHLAPGATLLASTDLADYHEYYHGHNKDRTPFHLVVVMDAEGVRIEGGGVIDGRGPAFWHEPTHPLDWIAEKERPSPMLECVRVRDLYLEDIRLQDSPGWTCHLHDCDRVTVRGVRIDNPVNGPNTDGFDINGSQDVTVSDCLIRTGDDGICLKTTPDARPCRRITIANCIVTSRCAALKLGCNESFADIDQVTIHGCVCPNSHRPIALYPFEGGTFADISISGIVADTASNLVLTRPIHIELRRNAAGSNLGRLENVTISDVTCRTEGRIICVAEPGALLRGITLRDIHLIYPTVDDPQLVPPGYGGNQYCKANPEAARARACVVLENVADIAIEHLRVTWPRHRVDHLGERNGTAWWPEEKAVNGSHDRFGRDQYNPGHAPPMHIVWARGATGRVRAWHAHGLHGARTWDTNGELDVDG